MRQGPLRGLDPTTHDSHGWRIAVLDGLQVAGDVLHERCECFDLGDGESGISIGPVPHDEHDFRAAGGPILVHPALLCADVGDPRGDVVDGRKDPQGPVDAFNRAVRDLRRGLRPVLHDVVPRGLQPVGQARVESRERFEQVLSGVSRAGLPRLESDDSQLFCELVTVVVVQAAAVRLSAMSSPVWVSPPWRATAARRAMDRAGSPSR